MTEGVESAERKRHVGDRRRPTVDQRIVISIGDALVPTHTISQIRRPAAICAGVTLSARCVARAPASEVCERHQRHFDRRLDAEHVAKIDNIEHVERQIAQVVAPLDSTRRG